MVVHTRTETRPLGPMYSYWPENLVKALYTCATNNKNNGFRIYEIISELSDVYEHYTFYLPNVTTRISEIHINSKAMSLLVIWIYKAPCHLDIQGTYNHVYLPYRLIVREAAVAASFACDHGVI